MLGLEPNLFLRRRDISTRVSFLQLVADSYDLSTYLGFLSDSPYTCQSAQRSRPPGTYPRSIDSDPAALIMWSGTLAPAVTCKLHAYIRWSCCAMPACVEFSPACPSFIADSSCEILPRGIAKRVTPPQRYENIPSSDSHRCHAGIV